MGNEARPTAQAASLLCVLDVGPAAASGLAPVDLAMSTAAALDPDGVMEIVASLEPQPLMDELRAAGYAAQALRSDDGTWVARVSRGRLPPFEDLTVLEPPLPLERVLLACAALTRGAVYTAWLPRRPMLLFAHLDARALEWRAEDHPDGSATLWVRKP
ncbi:MAG: DUF2249 domain-containing protein [Deltaproteobacteria bacterium]|nr:DUF2249 domain-containing protein [Deltaproteobacteria bacterium]